MPTESFEQDLFNHANRMRPGYEAFCCSIDLLGFVAMLRDNPFEAASRLNDLQCAFGDAMLLFPGGDDYRVCFVGDSVFVIKELAPEEDLEGAWSHYCGHLFAVSSYLHDLEQELGNPGLRVIVSYGRLSQIWEPDSWKTPLLSDSSKNWFVLTGASEALVKCTEAERVGQNAGFTHGYYWHEDRIQKRRYYGTKLFKISPTHYRNPGLYPVFYNTACEQADNFAALKTKDDDKAIIDCFTTEL